MTPTLVTGRPNAGESGSLYDKGDSIGPVPRCTRCRITGMLCPLIPPGRAAG